MTERPERRGVGRRRPPADAYSAAGLLIHADALQLRASLRPVVWMVLEDLAARRRADRREAGRWYLGAPHRRPPRSRSRRRVQRAEDPARSQVRGPRARHRGGGPVRAHGVCAQRAAGRRGLAVYGFTTHGRTAHGESRVGREQRKLHACVPPVVVAGDLRPREGCLVRGRGLACPEGWQVSVPISLWSFGRWRRVDGDVVDERRVLVVVGGDGDRRVLRRCRRSTGSVEWSMVVEHSGWRARSTPTHCARWWRGRIRSPVRRCWWGCGSGRSRRST